MIVIALLFMTAVLLTYVLAGSLALRHGLRQIARWRGNPPKPLGRTTKIIHATIVALAAFGLACFAWALFVEPYWPELTRTRVEVDGLPPDHRSIRVVQLTDLHSDPRARLEGELPDRVRALSPDLIALTGDAINDPSGLENYRRLAKALDEIAPTFAVLGNWDVWYWNGIQIHHDTGVRLLRGDVATLTVDDVTLSIGGASVDADEEIDRALDGLSDEGPTIFLHHFPEKAARGADRDVDLLLAGDTHGGQVRLPIVGALVEMARFGRYFDQGAHRLGRSTLYVNRGVGMEGGHAPRVRFLCRPEIALIELVPRS